MEKKKDISIGNLTCAAVTNLVTATPWFAFHSHHHPSQQHQLTESRGRRRQTRRSPNGVEALAVAHRHKGVKGEGQRSHGGGDGEKVRRPRERDLNNGFDEWVSFEVLPQSTPRASHATLIAYLGKKKKDLEPRHHRKQDRVPLAGLLRCPDRHLLGLVVAANRER